MAPTVRERQRTFEKDQELQARFAEVLQRVHVEEILWPDRNPAAFGRSFLVQYRGRRLPYPLIDPLERLRFVRSRLDQLSRTCDNSGFHPAVAFYYLSVFQEEHRPPSKSKKRSPAKKSQGKRSNKAKASTRADKKQAIYNRAQQLKRRLKVSPAVRKARGRDALLDAVLGEFRQTAARAMEKSELLRSAEIELEMFKEQGTLKESNRAQVKRLKDENSGLRLESNRLQNLLEAARRDFERLAQQSSGGSDLVEEHNALRHEFNLLSQKYDSLVNQNIELANRLERVTHGQPLNEILNMFRERINRVLRAGVERNDPRLLASIQGELRQLTRAREYLGRALYDVGLLYLREGDLLKAATELRAARELGIENEETNRVIHRVTGRR